LATRLYQMAILFSHANERKKADKDSSLADFTQLLEDLRTRLDEGYLFTKEQMRNIRTQAQDTIYEATRTSFMQMHTDVMQKLHDNKAPLKLNSVFGNPSREKSLVSLVKRMCSRIRNSLCQDIRNGICGDSPATLAEFTYSSATKFKRGGPGLNLSNRAVQVQTKRLPTLRLVQTMVQTCGLNQFEPWISRGSNRFKQQFKLV
ncbi:hypothetical protein DFH08DRAFT_709949, partial [Mycena albidolilacea]